MRPAVSTCCICAEVSFNPHPAGKPGATLAGGVGDTAKKAFQSSPGGEAGCDAGETVTAALLNTRFNPHPAGKPGATLGRVGNRV